MDRQFLSDKELKFIKKQFKKHWPYFILIFALALAIYTVHVDQPKRSTLDTLVVILVIIVWLGGGNSVIISSIKRQHLPWYSYFTGLSVLNAKDCFKLLLLLLLTLVIIIVRAEYL
jgi:hypothetical protein